MSRQRRLTTYVALAWAVAALAACGRRGPSEVPTIPFEKYQLENGLTVILSEDHRLPLVAVDVWYHVGPANEAAGRTGFAHLFEHMMFQGSKHVPGDSHFQLLESAGATTVNGTTGFDRTNYFETLPANELELGLWLESDRMGYLLDAVDELKLANQQAVVRNERRQSIENRPYGIANDALFRLVYPKGHPYAANVMGSHADIQAAKLDDVKAFFKQYYAPNNASLVIAGDFDRALARQQVERYFGPLKRGPDVPPVRVTTPPITEERRAVVTDRIQLPRVYLAWITPAFFKPGDAEADIVAGILGGGTSSRLYKSLVYEQQIAQDVSAFQMSMALGSMFQIVATVRPGHSPAEVEAAIDRELDAFRRDGPTDVEVTRAENLFETERLEELESIGGFGGVADTLNMFNHYVGDPGYLGTYLANHRNVSAGDARQFAETYLPRNARAVVEVVPGTPDLGEPVPTPPMPQVAPGTGAESINADAAWRATRPPASAEHALSLPPAKSFTLANGLTVIYQVRPEAPVAAAGLVLRTGGDANPPDRPGLANFVVTLLGQGTATRSAAQIADEFALNGSTLRLSSTKDTTWVATTSLPRNLEAVLNLMSDVALHPQFAADEIERQRASRLAELAAAEQDPNTVAARVANLALYGPAHPYGYIELGTPDSIRSATRDDVFTFWKRTYVPANAALVVNSPFDEDRLRPLLEHTFGAWTAGAGAAPQLDVRAVHPAGSRVIVVDTPGAQQTQVIVAGIGAARDVPEYPSLEVMNAVLGGLFSSRINLNLREAHGYTYGAASQFLYRKFPGPFWVSSAVRTDATADAIAQIFGEIERMGTAVISPAELTMGRDAIVRSLPDTFETGARTVGALGDLFVYRLGLDYYTRLPSAIAAVSADSVLAAARQYLHTDGLVVVAVGDRQAIEPKLRNLKLGNVDVWK